MLGNVLLITEMTGGESYRFVDAKNESGRKNCLARQILE